MEQHDLIAAYALDALEPHERREFEQHLLTCERCRSELPSLQEAAGALAFAVDAPAPPSALRARILEQARGERQNVVPLRRQRPFLIAVAGAALAAAAAIALAFWGVSLQRDLDAERTAHAEIVSIVADSSARDVPLDGASGTLVVTRSGKAAILLEEPPPVPDGKVMEAWVIDGGKPVPAGVFEGNEHVLDEPVPAGATVAVTIEDGPVDAPTTEPVARATA